MTIPRVDDARRRELPARVEDDVPRDVVDWMDAAPPESRHGRGRLASVPRTPEQFTDPEDRGKATPSRLSEVEYVDDLIRPGRIVVWAAEEGTGKSYALLELEIRVATAGGRFAGTWEARGTGPVLGLSEMHPDDDYQREETTLASLGLDRRALEGRLYRLDLITAAGGRPALTVPAWRTYIVAWLRSRQARLLVIDTATGATQVDPWGREIQEVYRDLRLMLDAYPELAIVLVVHCKKPTGRGEKRLSDVLGEWGRWCDVVVLQENEGGDLERARITVRKRVRRERRIVARKRGGLLVDAADIEAAGPKVRAEDVLASVASRPGMTILELAGELKVSKATAANYVKGLGDQVRTDATGPRGAIRVFPTAQPPNSAESSLLVGPSAVASTVPAADHRTAERMDIRSAVGSSVAAVGADIPVEEDYPPSTWDVGDPLDDQLDRDG